jgi:hypothetical protein
MKRFWKTIGIIALVFIIAGVIVGVTLYNKPHRNIQKAKVDYTINASELLKSFDANNASAEKTYFGKIILVKGEIKTIAHTETTSSVIIAGESDFFGVNCSFNPSENLKVATLKEGQSIQVKGECKGYIDDVILVNCYLTDYKK